MYTSTLFTHLYIVLCEGGTDYKFTADGCATDSCAKVEQIIRLCICNVVDVHCMVSSDSRCVSAVCACSPVEMC